MIDLLGLIGFGLGFFVILAQTRALHRKDKQLRVIDRAVDAMPPEGQLYVRQHLDEALARAGVPR